MGVIEEIKQTDEERFPELFCEDKNIDRHKCHRVVPMKVLVLGMMRTGTACEIPSGLEKLTVD